VLGEIEAHVDLFEQNLQPGERIASGPGDDPPGTALGEQLTVGKVGLIATQIQIDTRGARDRA